MKSAPRCLPRETRVLTSPTPASPRASSRARTFSPVPTGTVLFITTTRPCRRRQLVDDRPHAPRDPRRPSTSAACPRQTKTKSAPSTSRATSSVNRRRSRVAREQLLESRLVDRDLAARERLDPLGNDVPDDDLVAQLREARGSDEAYPAGADDRRSATSRPRLLSGSGRNPFATASIVSFDSSSSRVLTTQYTPLARRTTMCSFEPLVIESVLAAP